eukprot:gene5703-14943_t
MSGSKAPYQQWPPATQSNFSPVGHNKSNHTWDASAGRANLSALADRYANSPRRSSDGGGGGSAAVVSPTSPSRPSSPPNRLPSSLNPEGSVFGWSGPGNIDDGERAAKAARGCGAHCLLFLEATGLLDCKRMFPIVNWLPNYSKKNAVGDVIAGLTVGMM